MKKFPARYPRFIGLKLPAELAEELRRHAHEDHRTVSGYLRRLITAALRPQPAADRESESR